VVNLQGLAYMVDHHRDPFAAIDEVLAGLDTPNILVDFHAEATAEKAAPPSDAAVHLNKLDLSDIEDN